MLSPRQWQEQHSHDADHAKRFGLSSYGFYEDYNDLAEDALREMSLREEFPSIESVEARRYRRWKAEQDVLERAAA